jgi:long-chain acyl-CoA synthetase
MGLSQGASMGICRGITTILEDLQLVRPTVLFSVPALYKKVYDGVYNAIETGGPLKKSLMQKALAVGHARALSRNGKRGPLASIEQLQHYVLDRLILSKIRDKFGGRMRYGCVAGAACPIEVVHFMDSIGIPLCEGYGLTETSPIIALNVPGSRIPGSVGRAIGGVSVHIIGEEGQVLPPGDEGEICCTGPNIMKGYHNNEGATQEVISTAPDGTSRMYG